MSDAWRQSQGAAQRLLLSTGAVWPSSSAVGMHLSEQLAVGVSDLEEMPSKSWEKFSAILCILLMRFTPKVSPPLYVCPRIFKRSNTVIR